MYVCVERKQIVISNLIYLNESIELIVSLRMRANLNNFLSF